MTSEKRDVVPIVLRVAKLATRISRADMQRVKLNLEERLRKEMSNNPIRCSDDGVKRIDELCRESFQEVMGVSFSEAFNLFQIVDVQHEGN